MRLLLPLISALLGFGAFTSAQDPVAANCPTISVNGPRGSTNVGELATYTATVGNAEQYSLEYTWSVSAGRIKDGQGTSSIRVIQPNSSLTSTVDVKGLPEGCPATASEYSSRHPPPKSVKIYELQPNDLFRKAAATRVAAIMLENPNNQLYVLAGDVGRKNSRVFQQKQGSVIDLLSKQGIMPDRITIVSVYSDVELFQFWRVPPGAENPRCEECDDLERAQKECPRISVTGPAGVVEPGKNMTFVATVTGATPKRTRYIWSIDSGKIIDGQGTLKLIARHHLRWGGTVTATLTVIGLPEDCPRSAADMYALAVRRGPEKLGSVTNPTYTIGRQLISKIATSLREAPNSQLYVWVYVGSEEAKFPQLETHLVGQLSRTKIDRSRFTIMATSENGRGAAFWLIRPGVENPAP